MVRDYQEERMAKYRPIYTKIWRDPDFQELETDGKLIFVYLCTNESVTESGIYPITAKTISNDTDIPRDRVDEILNGGIKNIVYDPENHYVFVRKAIRYHPIGGKPDNRSKAISTDYQHSLITPLWQEFVKEYPELADLLQALHQPLANPLEGESQPLANPLPTPSANPNPILIPNPIPNLNLKEKSKKYGEFLNVLLTSEEYRKLEDKFNTSLPEMIEALSLGIERKGYKYRSHYAAILSWHRKSEKESKAADERVQQNRRVPTEYSEPYD